ncbi:DENN domain-containing protein 3-like [Sphaerodactylus townsendi]|uniref:DENN domain-containing protein 3-like n=1 Tax=Sphaerodactylus townsendi TaxID=933632 RepID=UPI002025D044|nr:DENN domain-containing protein 3-like [Sphaerodactylus townsendi]
MENVLPSAVLEICVLVGAPRDKVKEACQASQKNDVKNFPAFEPEVLSVFVPPFITRQEFQATTINPSTFNNRRRRSFRKKKDKSKIESARALNGALNVPETEDISVPKDVDLNGLPQLCFPGGFFITSESMDDHIHFLVFTDVCGNRTYGVVAQYYHPVQNGHISSNGQVLWEASKGAAYFVPYAICVISRYPYFNALKDCLSCLLIQLKPYKDLDVDDYIKEFAAKLSLIPSPPPGPLHLIFNLKPLQVIFPSQEDPDSSIIDLDLHLPFLCFKPDQVLQVRYG